MSKLETPEAFARAIEKRINLDYRGEQDGEELWVASLNLPLTMGMVAARDNAVRLALLDEIWADAERLKLERNIIPFRGAVLLARSKYRRLATSDPEPAAGGAKGEA